MVGTAVDEEHSYAKGEQTQIETKAIGRETSVVAGCRSIAGEPGL